jgi:hypothetical protein
MHGCVTFRYVVRAEIEDPARSVEYQRWLIDEGHVAEVCRVSGASAEVVRIDAPVPTLEVRYAFPSRAAFAVYERDHAPRLRAEGAARFGVGVRFTRSTGDVVHAI